MIKTRVQTWDLVAHGKAPSAAAPAPALATQPLLQTQAAQEPHPTKQRPSTFAIAREAYRAEGVAVFFRGLGVCSARAFIVNAVQWAVSTISIALHDNR